MPLFVTGHEGDAPLTPLRVRVREETVRTAPERQCALIRRAIEWNRGRKGGARRKTVIEFLLSVPPQVSAPLHCPDPLSIMCECASGALCAKNKSTDVGAC